MAKLFGRDDGPANGRHEGGGVATREREQHDGGAVAAEERHSGTNRSPGLGRDAELRQRDEYGGFNLGAAFFGWLVAVGMGVLLTAIIAAAGTAIGFNSGAGKGDAGTIGIVGGALLIAIGFLAYYCGGYVAGRMSRFDGARQGFGVWAFGLVMTLLLGAAGAIFGSEYNVLEQLNLPRIPVSTSDLTTGGIIALVAIVLATLIGAIMGGKVGERYHRKVDRAAHGA